MIFNLFSYKGNFGRLKIYKCDYFGQRLSQERICHVENFSSAVDQENVDHEILFGSFNQSNDFRIANQKIQINADIFFANSLDGTLFPAVDLLFNLCAWSYQGTHAPYKVSIQNVTSTTLEYIDTLPIDALSITTANLSMFKFFLVNETSFVQLTPSSIDTIGHSLTYSSVTTISDCWLAIFKYGNLDTLSAFPTVYEPMFRIDSSEGSFYPCLVDKIDFSMEEDYVSLKCSFLSMNYDRSTRYNFINTTSVNSIYPGIKILHKSRIKIEDYSNGLTSDFNLVGLSDMAYVNALLTNKFSHMPVTKLSIKIDNGLDVIHNNTFQEMKRTYVVGIYSKLRKIEGTMNTLALRSINPTFERYMGISNNTTKSISIIFGNQKFSIPYTVWKPGDVTIRSDDYVSLQFAFTAITKERQGQPLFELNSGVI